MRELGDDPADRIVGEERPKLSGGGTGRAIVRRTWKPLGIAIVLFAVLYYPLGSLLIQNISDDPDYRVEPVDLPSGGSYVVATVAGLLDREVNENWWTPNDPWFLPSAALDNMPNFQLGVLEATNRLTIELVDQLGRVRGSSAADEDLKEARSRLSISGTKWSWNPSVSLMPTTPAESEYRAAIRNLRNYNTRLAAGSAVFDRRVDNLQVTIERFATDLGAASQAIDDHVRNYSGGWWFDFRVDDEFYRVKGKSYAYYLMLRDLGRDFDGILAERNLTRPWTEMLAVMRSLAELDPLIVQNGSPDGMIFPNHLTSQGFHLLRARTKLKEISSILLK
ncbi:MAG: DUF2333 family protein [Minwuia sp.]|nr:DUF2333 family protein [Minwuia sp.]